MPSSTQRLPTSEHFRLERRAEGVYAAIALEGGAAFSNAGIIDLGDQTLVFDTFETPRAAKHLRAAAEQLTGRPTSWVINSHFHLDHWLGNQVFADHAIIVATHQTRERMPGIAEYVRGLQADPSELEQMLRQEAERLETQTDERRRREIQSSIARWEFALESLPTVELCPPDLTFDGKLLFHGAERRAELLTRGIGHTPDDCVLVLPDEKITFAGDLAFFGRQPFMANCDPQAWVAQLTEMDRSDCETFVPGHGPVGTRADIGLEKQYIITLGEMVGQALEADEPIEAMLKRPLPAPFDAWSVDGTASEVNVRFLHERLSGQGPR